MIRIGNKEILLNTVLLVPESEKAEMMITVEEGDELGVVLKFEETAKVDEINNPEPSMHIVGQGNTAIITLTDWTKTFGSNISTPLHFANDDKGANIYFMMSVMKLGSMYKVDFQVMRDMEVGDG